MNTTELTKVCRQVRRDIIEMTANAGSGHPGGSLSAVELLTSVFYNHMRVDPKNPDDPNRDRFVLSKGHAAPCYYGVLAEMGFISRDEFAADPIGAYENRIYCKNAPMKTAVIWNQDKINMEG